MVGPEGPSMELEHEIVRRVLDRADLLEYHLPFEFEIILPQGRMAYDVGEHVEGPWEILIEDAGLEGRVLTCGVRIERATATFEFQSDVAGSASLRSLEHHVFEEVRHAHLGGGLMSRGRPDPNTDRHRSHTGKHLGKKSDPVLAGGPIETLVQPDRLHIGTVTLRA
jgi:hypothetical protein